MTSDIKWGAFIWPEGLNFEEMKQFCLRAEELHFDLFQTTDHFMNMRQPTRSDRHPLECWTTLAGLGAVTSKILLGPLVACYAYRAPPVLAKMATTVDIISNGRVILGVGAGWHEAEFKAYFGRFPPVRERLQGLEETVEICKSMFNNKYSTYRGKLFSVKDALNSPASIQQPIPIMVGGGGEKVTLKIVAKHADMCHFFANDLATLDRKLAALKKHCKTVGRDYNEITKCVGIATIVGNTTTEAEGRLARLAKLFHISPDAQRKQLGKVYGAPDEVADYLQNYVSRGVQVLTPRFFYMDSMEAFATEVMPKV